MTFTLGVVHSALQSCDFSVKIYSVFDKDQKVDFKLGGRGSVRPRRVIQGIQALYRGGIGSKSLSQEVGRIPDDGKWTMFSCSQNCALSNRLESGFICDAELCTTKLDDNLQASGTAADFGRLNKMGDTCCYRIPQKPFAPPGLLSLGLCGNALIMRIGSDARCFHQQSISGELVDLGEHTTCGNMLYPPSDAKVFGWSRSGIGGSISEVKIQKGVSLVPKPITTKSRDRQNKQKVGKTATLTRDLYERSSFQLFEILLRYPFSNTNAVASNLQLPSRKSLKEFGSTLNQAAVGLAGVSATWVLFVASRILWLDVSLNKHNITGLAIGFGFLSLSWAIKRVSDAFMSLANVHGKSTAFKEENITGLQKELQSIALNAILLVVMCFMGGG